MIVKSALLQLNCSSERIDFENSSISSIKDFILSKHIKYIEEAGNKGVQILCLQELFNSPYFCPSQNSKWLDIAEKIPGKTTEILSLYSRKYNMVLIAPIFEKEIDGVYYNTAAVINSDGNLLGIYRKNHIPQTNGFWEKFYFKPGNLGYPVFNTTYAKIGVYICYDRHFPEGARIYGLKGAEIVYNPSATVESLSKHLWKIEQPSYAVTNRYFMGCVNRVGIEKPWNLGNFYGNSYFVDPNGRIIAEAGNKDELLIADLNLDLIEESRRIFQFYRDRRPDTYTPIIT